MGCCEQLTRRLLVPSAQHVVCMSQACAGNRSFGMRFLSTCLPTGRSCPVGVARLAAMRPDGHAHRLVCLRGLSSAPCCLRLIRTVQTRRAFNALSVICPKQLHHMPDVLSVTGGSVHTLDNERRRTFLKCGETTLSSLCSAIVRQKSTKAGKTSAHEDLEDDESDEESDTESDNIFFEEDSNFPLNYRDIKVHLKSLRLDGIVSSGLVIARNKVDEYFLGSKLRLNGQKVLKKSKQMKVGDHVDLVTAHEDGKLKVKRVRIVKVDSKKSNKERLSIHLRVWRGNVLIDDTD